MLVVQNTTIAQPRFVGSLHRRRRHQRQHQERPSLRQSSWPLPRVSLRLRPIFCTSHGLAGISVDVVQYSRLYNVVLYTSRTSIAALSLARPTAAQNGIDSEHIHRKFWLQLKTRKIYTYLQTQKQIKYDNVQTWKKAITTKQHTTMKTSQIGRTKTVKKTKIQENMHVDAPTMKVCYQNVWNSIVSVTIES